MLAWIILAATSMMALPLYDAVFPVRLRYRGAGPARGWFSVYPRHWVWRRDGIPTIYLWNRTFQTKEWSGGWMNGSPWIGISSHSVSFGRHGWKDDLNRKMVERIWM